MPKQKWLHDKTNEVYYRVTPFRHATGRMMEEWLCSNGERWYLSPGVTLETVLAECVLEPCDPIPGMLSITFD